MVTLRVFRSGPADKQLAGPGLSADTSDAWIEDAWDTLASPML